MAGSLHSIAEGDDARGLNDHIAVRIVRISEALARTATRTIEARFGLSNTDLRLLNTLDGEEALSVSEVARRVHVDKGWISRTLRALEARGLVTRRGHEADSRRTSVSLSPAGRALLEEVRPHALRSELALLEGIDARALKAMLDRVEANAVAALERLLEEGGR